MRVFAAVALAVLSAACSQGPRQARPGDRVAVEYEAYVDGRRFEAGPAELTLGQGALPAAVERALTGLSAGQEARLTVPEAYGPRDPAKVERLPLAAFGDMKAKLAPGLRVLGVKDGKAAEADVLAVQDGKVTLDFNHRLAGKAVEFRVRLRRVDAP